MPPDTPLDDLSPPALTHAIEANLFAMVRHLGAWEAIDADLSGRLMRLLSDVPFPLFNSVVQANLPAEDAGEAIAEVQAAARERGVPVLWWTGPSTRPIDLTERLLARGFTLAASMPGMAADIDALRSPLALAGGVALDVVSDEDALRAWSRTVVAGFGMPGFLVEPFVDFFRSSGSFQGPPFVNLLATMNGEPVGTATLFLGAGVAGLYNIVTLPHARRRGIGRALTVAPMLYARDLGYRGAILHASAMARPLYERLGFREYCGLQQYLWAPGVTASS